MIEILNLESGGNVKFITIKDSSEAWGKAFYKKFAWVAGITDTL